MSTEMINFLTTKFKTSLKEVEQGGGQSEFPLRKIFHDISLVLEIKVTSSRHIQSGDSPLMECLYMFNDAITECGMLHEARRRRALARYTPKEWYQLRRIKSQLLKTLRELHSVTDASLSTSIEGTTATASQQITRSLERLQPEVIHGFDERMEEIVTSLRRKGESYLNKIGIVGMGGSGKTTLGQLVYNHPVVKRKFFPRIWVGLPNEFERGTHVTKRITKHILEQLGAGKEHEKKDDDDDELLVTLYRHLYGKKFLIVFDNVWNLTSWYHNLVNTTQITTQQGFVSGLPKWYGGGIIIISRLEEDVKQVIGEENLHRSPTLNEKDLWLIFLDEMINDKFDSLGPRILVKIDDMRSEIVENFDGLPSAAKTLARIFFHGLPQDFGQDKMYIRTPTYFEMLQYLRVGPPTLMLNKYLPTISE